MINKIISAILTVLFAVDSFFCGFMTCNRIKIEESDETVKKILDAAQYLGVNLVREDFVGWGSMQSGEGEQPALLQQGFGAYK